MRKAGEKIARVCCADRPAARAAAGVALSAFEPDDLIVEVAKVYSRLCFVIGCVAPNVDEQSSRFVHGGRSWGWRLSSRRKEAIWKQLVPEETDDNTDEVLWGEVQADWQMMDEVVAHWRPKMDCAMAGAALIFAHGGTLASVDSGPRDEYASPP